MTIFDPGYLSLQSFLKALSLVFSVGAVKLICVRQFFVIKGLYSAYFEVSCERDLSQQFSKIHIKHHLWRALLVMTP